MVNSDLQSMTGYASAQGTLSKTGSETGDAAKDGAKTGAKTGAGRVENTAETHGAYKQSPHQEDATQDDAGGLSWSWELRSVNARGLDLRLRLPEGLPGLEQKLRARLAQGLTRGSVALSLRLTREDSLAQAAEIMPDARALETYIGQLQAATRAADKAGLVLAPVTAAALLCGCGVLDGSRDRGDGHDPEATVTALMADFEGVFGRFIEMRRAEGAVLGEIVSKQIDRIAELTAQAARLAAERAPERAAALTAALARVMEVAEGADPDRITQELALLAVKADVTEEIDRLGAHIQAARELLSDAGPGTGQGAGAGAGTGKAATTPKGARGRRFDFLMQEFNREANTLCSKSQDRALTACGLDLKAVIDQMREQIQNME